MLYWSSRILQRMSPLGWLAGGVVLALSFPAVRKRLRSAVVTATAGVMSATDPVKETDICTQDEMGSQIQDTQNMEADLEKR